MDAPRKFVYIVDADGRLVSVSPEWVGFAQENDAAGLDAAAVSGKPLLDYVADDETRHLYQSLMEKVRATGRALTVPFRCDSSGRRRFMELAISPAAEGTLVFESRLVREEERAPVAILDSTVDRSDVYVVICGWCKRVEAEGDWVEVEEAVQRLGLFDSASLPRLTHGICGECAAAVQAELD